MLTRFFLRKRAISVKWYGAKGNNSTNDQTALAAALLAGKYSKSPVYLPPGVYKHNNVLDVDGIHFYGDGPKSVLVATNPAKSAIRMRGVGAQVSDLKTTCPTASVRSPLYDGEGIRVMGGCSNFRVSDVIVDRCASAGIFVNNGVRGAGPPYNGVIEKNIVMNSLADGIHMVDGASHINVVGNTVINSGDDMIACVSYRNGAPLTRRINVINNVGRNQTIGKGISVLGGERINIISNNLRDTWGSGICISAEGGYDCQLVRYVNVENNIIVNVGRSKNSIFFPGIYVFGRKDFSTTFVNVNNNIVDNCNWYGIRVWCNCDTINITKNQLRNIRGIGIHLVDELVTKGEPAGGTRYGVGNITCKNNLIEETLEHGIYAQGSATYGIINFSNNRFENINSSNNRNFDVIKVDNAVNIKSLTIANNRHINPANYRFGRLVQVGPKIKKKAITNNSTSRNLLDDRDPIEESDPMDDDPGFNLLDESDSGFDPFFFEERRHVSQGTSAPTDGTWSVGDTIYNTAPTLANNISHWTCITAGGPGTWIAHGWGTGTTNQRPTLVMNDAGYQYRDTTTGTLVSWSGTTWS